MIPTWWCGNETEADSFVWGLLCPSAFHKIEWQFKVTQGCDRHLLRLLLECSNCGARFKSPALWVNGWYQQCFTPFAEMTSQQKIFYN